MCIRFFSFFLWTQVMNCIARSHSLTVDRSSVGDMGGAEGHGLLGIRSGVISNMQVVHNRMGTKGNKGRVGYNCSVGEVEGFMSAISGADGEECTECVSVE